jgi:hypothetical protein
VDEAWPSVAADWNEWFLENDVMTDEESEEDPYPEEVSLRVFAPLDFESYGGTGSEEDPFIWADTVHWSQYTQEHIVDPYVIDRYELIEDEESGTTYYTIAFEDENGEYTYVRDVPRTAFFMTDEAQTGDQFTPGAFRHTIGIPDDVFPKGKWRDLKK